MDFSLRDPKTRVPVVARDAGLPELEETGDARAYDDVPPKVAAFDAAIGLLALLLILVAMGTAMIVRHSGAVSASDSQCLTGMSAPGPCTTPAPDHGPTDSSKLREGRELAGR
jgi:hypothetical protein